jgi:hypothetical protein
MWYKERFPTGPGGGPVHLPLSLRTWWGGVQLGSLSLSLSLPGGWTQLDFSLFLTQILGCVCVCVCVFGGVQLASLSHTSPGGVESSSSLSCCASLSLSSQVMDPVQLFSLTQILTG